MVKSTTLIIAALYHRHMSRRHNTCHRRRHGSGDNLGQEITRIAIGDDRIASMVARPEGFTVDMTAAPVTLPGADPQPP